MRKNHKHNRRNWKKKGCLLLCICLLLGQGIPLSGFAEETPPTAVTAANNEELLTFNAQTGAITNCDSSITGVLVIPSEIDGVPVTTISSNAFSSCTQLTEVSIPKTVTAIDMNAFYGCSGLQTVTFEEGTEELQLGRNLFSYCTSLTEITLPDTVTSMGDTIFYFCINLKTVHLPKNLTRIENNLFWGCTSLTEISIPETVTSIGSYAFNRCGLTKITLPDAIEQIEDYAFNACSFLSEIQFGNGIQSIGNSAFSGCTALRTVTLPASLKELGGSCFANCSGLEAFYVDTDNKNFTSNDGILFEGTHTLVSFPQGKLLPSYTLPERTRAIQAGAFANCTALHEIILPDSLISIGDSAFVGCTNLTEITIPAGVTEIGGGIFEGCSGLTNIVVSDENNAFLSDGGILFDTEKTRLLHYPAGKYDLSVYQLPDTVTSLDPYAFEGCLLTEIILPTGLTTLSTAAFQNCTALEKINLPEGLDQIPIYAFSGCKSLKDIVFPESLRIIQNYAFQKCTSLPSITLSKNVVNIAGGAFAYCTNMEAINIEEDNPSYVSVDGVVYNNNPINYMNRIYVYPAGKKDETYIMPESVSSTNPIVFAGAAYLKNIILSSRLKTIASSAFLDCTALESVTIPAKTTEIQDYVFAGCTNLSEIIVEEANAYYTSEDGVLFSKDKSRLLQYPAGKTDAAYTVPDSVTTINSNAFKHANYLETINLPENLTKLDTNTFLECENLRSVTLPAGLTSLGTGVFKNCKNLTEIAIPENVITIPNEAFSGCTALTTVNLTNGLSQIASNAFLNCTSLSSITIPASVQVIAPNAFAHCSSLQSVQVEEENPYFTDVQGVLMRKDQKILYLYPAGNPADSYTLPAETELISPYAFLDCDNLTSLHLAQANAYYTEKDGVIFDKTGNKLLFCPTGLLNDFYAVPDGTTGLVPNAFSQKAFSAVLLPDSLLSIPKDTINTSVIYANNDTVGAAYANIFSIPYKSDELYANVIETSNGWQWTAANPAFSSEMTLIVGLYREDILLAYERIMIDDTAKAFQGTLTSDTVPDTIKFFVWDSTESMQPIFSAESIAL